MRERDGIKTSFTLQVDTACHHLPRFIEKAGRAGCTKVFIGKEKAWIDPDLNRYDTERPCSKHLKMSQEEWMRAYEGAWRSFYTFEHIETITALEERGIEFDVYSFNQND
jgi:hypothetical protein